MIFFELVRRACRRIWRWFRYERSDVFVAITSERKRSNFGEWS